MNDKPLRIEDGSVSFGSVEVFRDLSLEIAVVNSWPWLVHPAVARQLCSICSRAF